MVFDNGSQDGSAEWIQENHPEVHVVRSEVNIGFAAAMNRLVRAARDADAVAFLNNDTRVEPDWLAALVEALQAAPRRCGCGIGTHRGLGSQAS